MNTKIQYALNKDSGDVFAHFKTYEHLIDNNSGIRDNRTMTFEAQQSAAPFDALTETKVKLTDPNIDIVNMDKNFIRCRYRVALSSQGYGWGAGSIFNMSSAANNFGYVFIGFKSAAESIFIYRVFWNGNTTECFNTNSIYEATITRAVKPKSEQFGRKSMYTTFENATSKKENVCGVYVPLADAFNLDGSPKTFSIEFEGIIQIDDILPFSGMSLWPRCTHGDLELQLQFAFRRALVYCTVNPFEMPVYSQNLLGFASYNSAIQNSVKGQSVTNEIIQAGDSGNIYIPVDVSLSEDFPYKYVGQQVRISVVSGSILHCSTTVSGYRIKDSEINNLRVIERFNIKCKHT